ncbi:MAG: alpha/beta hydrolase [Sphingopyxis sp.]
MTPDNAATVYLHGQPGSSAELALFGLNYVVDYAPGRHDVLLGYPVQLAKDVTRALPHRSLHLVGFSLGAFAALRLAALLGDKVTRIDLISPAAPLDGGDFLPNMAGRAVFTLARDWPHLFWLMTWVQSGMTKIAPKTLFWQVFADAAGEDRALAADPVFKARWQDMARASLSCGAPSYRAEIAAYVSPWAYILPQILCPVTIWHGESDNWAPPAMADYLALSLPNVAGVHRFAGLSHYSALKAALPHILSYSPGDAADPASKPPSILNSDPVT